MESMTYLYLCTKAAWPRQLLGYGHGDIRFTIFLDEDLNPSCPKTQTNSRPARRDVSE